MNDRFVRTLLVGLAASLVMLGLSEIDYALHISHTTLIERAAAIFVTPANSLSAKAVGFFAHLALSLMYTMIFYYLLLRTGKKLLIVKGLIIAMLAWLAFGVFSRLMGIHALFATDGATTLTYFVNHLAWGLTLAIGVRIADG